VVRAAAEARASAGVASGLSPLPLLAPVHLAPQGREGPLPHLHLQDVLEVEGASQRGRREAEEHEQI